MEHSKQTDPDICQGIYRGIPYVCRFHDGEIHVHCSIDGTEKAIPIGKGIERSYGGAYIEVFAQMYMDLAIEESAFEKRVQAYAGLHPKTP